LLANKRTCPTAQSTAARVLLEESTAKKPFLCRHWLHNCSWGCNHCTQQSNADHNMAPALPASAVARRGMWRHTHVTPQINHTLCKMPTPVRGWLCKYECKGCRDSKMRQTTTTTLVVQLSGTIPSLGDCRGNGMHCCCARHARWGITDSQHRTTHTAGRSTQLGRAK
jgi:hypothetical protein